MLLWIWSIRKDCPRFESLNLHIHYQRYTYRRPNLMHISCIRHSLSNDTKYFSRLAASLALFRQISHRGVTDFSCFRRHTCSMPFCASLSINCSAYWLLPSVPGWCLFPALTGRLDCSLSRLPRCLNGVSMVKDVWTSESNLWNLRQNNGYRHNPVLHTLGMVHLIKLLARDFDTPNTKYFELRRSSISITLISSTWIAPASSKQVWHVLVWPELHVTLHKSEGNESFQEWKLKNDNG